MQKKEEIDATFYPTWYKPNNCRRISPVPEEILALCSPQLAGDSLSKARVQTEAQGAVQAMSEPQIQPQSPWSLPLSTELHPQPYLPLPHQSGNQSQPLSLLHESQSQPRKVAVELGSAFIPVPQWRITRQEAAGEAGITEEESEEEEDMQGWVCLPGTVDKSFSPVEDSFDLGEGSLDSFSDNNDSPSSIPPKETHSGLERSSSEMDKDTFELNDGMVENKEEKGQHDMDNLDLKCASELKEGGLGEGDFEPETINEVQGNELSGSEKDTVAMREDRSKPENDSLDAGDHGAESTNSLRQAEFEAEISGFAEKKENGENIEQCEAKMETSIGETEEKITSPVSLQVSVVWFYLHHHHRPGYCTLHPRADVATPPHCLLLLLSSFGLLPFMSLLQLG